MKFKIINETKLPIELIGKVIDLYLKDDKEITIYESKEDAVSFSASLGKEKPKKYRLVVRYTKTIVEYRIMEG